MSQNNTSPIITELRIKRRLSLHCAKAKQCRDILKQPYACDTFPVLGSVAVQFGFIRSLLLDLESYGGNDPDGMFPFFLLAGSMGAGT